MCFQPLTFSHYSFSFSAKFSSFEYLPLSLSLSSMSKFGIVIVYRHDHPATSSNFCTEFNSLLESITATFASNFMIVGDFNYWIDCPVNFYCKQFISLLDSHGISKPVVSPSHISGHTLDLMLFPEPVISSDPLPPVIQVFPPDSLISDHSLLLYTLPTPCSASFHSFSYRHTKFFHPTVFATYVFSILPQLMFYSLSTMDLYTVFHQKLSFINDAMFPLVTRSSSRLLTSPWVDSNFIRQSVISDTPRESGGTLAHHQTGIISAQRAIPICPPFLPLKIYITNLGLLFSRAHPNYYGPP